MLGAGSPSLAKSYPTTKEALGGLIAVRKTKQSPPPDIPPLSTPLPVPSAPVSPPSSLGWQYGIVVVDYPSRASSTTTVSSDDTESGFHENMKEIV